MTAYRNTLTLTAALVLALVMVMMQAGAVPVQAQGVPVTAGNVYRVAMNGAADPACGQSWGTPCDLQYALTTRAVAGGELWVQAGEYKPGNTRTAAFQLRDGISLYGGFAGVESERTQRDPAVNVTILSGDIGAIGNNSDNVYHVVTAYLVSSATVLDGFVIRGGNADAGTGNFGAGIYSQDSSPTLVDLVITDNATNGAGGGMFVMSHQALRANYSAPLLTRVVFSGNTAARGGGLFTQNANPVLTDVTFVGNTATGGAGGGINNQVLYEDTDEYSVPVLTNVTFSGNSARGGGGLFNGMSNPVLTNVTFSGNTASIRGGAILNEGASPILRNVTISGNSAPAGLGGAIRNIINEGTVSNPQIYNSVVWGNGSGEITSDGTGATTLIDSVVQGGCLLGAVCTNVISGDPVLGGLANNGGATQTMAIGAGSSALDAGGVNSACAAVDQRGVVRPQGSGCDIGAFEYGTMAATASYGGIDAGAIVPKVYLPTVTNQ